MSKSLISIPNQLLDLDVESWIWTSKCGFGRQILDLDVQILDLDVQITQRCMNRIPTASFKPKPGQNEAGGLQEAF